MKKGNKNEGTFLDTAKYADKEKIIDMIALVLIAAIGLLTAYVTFGILDSSAEANIHQYKVGGAIAGFLVTCSVLGSIYLQIRKSSGELNDLRERNEALQQKLIRGAPRPPGFETEVAELQRIVLARPRDWERRGGVIFDYELPEDQLKSGDFLPARFTCTFTPITSKTSPREKYYNDFRDSAVDNPYIISHTSELFSLGGEPNSIESLKMITHQCVEVRIKRDPVTGVVNREWGFIPSAQLEQLQQEQTHDTDEKKSRKRKGQTAASDEPPDDNSLETNWLGEVQRTSVVCYHGDLGLIFIFDFVDNNSDFLTSSALFNQILSSIRFLT